MLGRSNWGTRTLKKYKKRKVGSATFSASFAGLILILSILLLVLFYILAALINGSASIPLRLPLGSIDRWSSIADFMSATLGISVSLGGSVMAIYLAHRAYMIAQKQSFMEERAITSEITNNTVETLWNMSGALRNLFDKIDNLVNDALAVGEQQHYDGAEKNDLFKNFYESQKDFLEATEQVRLGLMLVIKDPIARKSFDIASKRFRAEMQEQVSNCDNKKVLDAWSDVLGKNSDLDMLAKLINRKRNLDSASPSLPSRIVFMQDMLTAYQTDDGIVYLRREVKRSRDGSSETYTKTRTLSEIEAELRINSTVMRRKMQNPDTVLSLIGAHISMELLHDRDSEIWLNTGAVALTCIIYSYPNADDLLKSHERYLSEDLGFGIEAMLNARLNLQASGIDNFLPKQVRLAAEGFMKSPEKAILDRPGRSA